MNKKIPLPLIAALSDLMTDYYTHTDITSQFMLCDIEIDERFNKSQRITHGLKKLNKNHDSIENLAIFLSKALEREDPFLQPGFFDDSKNKLKSLLIKHKLNYQSPGILTEISQHISSNSTPLLATLTHEYIQDNINKAQNKLNNDDYTGCITNCRTLSEHIMLEIIRNFGDTEFKSNGDLNILYKEVKKLLSLDNKDYDQILKQILGGLNSIVSGIAGLSNNSSDRHATRYKPSKHHAKLAINSTFTLCEFLLDSYNYQKNK